jgi:hypothetical protein
MKLATKRALILFCIAYLAVNIVATAISVTYGVVNHSPQPQDLGVGLLEAPAFANTVLYQALVMYVIWPLFAWLYFRKRSAKGISRQEIWSLSWVWAISAMVADFVFFVVPKVLIPADVYAFTLHEFYVDYQPWISLIYIGIFTSPWIYFGLARLAGKKLKP